MGVIFHEMLSGIRPTIIHAPKNDNTSDYMVRLTLPDSAPDQLTRIVQKCVTSHAPDWYADADELADDLRSFLAGSLTRIPMQ